MLLKNGFDPGIHLYLQHGWGFNRDCFQKWIPALKGTRVTILDRGYLGAESAFFKPLSNEYTVLVCHSLGVHFFSKCQLKDVDLLVVLGGFVCFHGLHAENQISRKHISRMQRRMSQEPEKLLNDFYRDCSWPSELPDFSCLNIALLAEDLLLLDTVCLQPELSNDAKVLIVHGSDDRLVPVDRAYELQRQLAGTLHLIAGAGHGLPFTHVEQCLSIIKDQLRDCESK